ncbi:zinc ribbon domain-containing protein [Domibacillus sp. PGB-M46]|uniref:zinc ribbon domain-containing protein n=1 Tax=Domibacillus sp. PGB-M46 TaxID=2910255 RepID=UPI0035C90F8A
MFRQFLAYKCERNGGQLVKVKPHFTIQDCSYCGKRVKKSLSVRTHACPDCGLVLDRDHNAALNIEKAGLAQIGAIPAIYSLYNCRSRSRLNSIKQRLWR